MGMVEYKDNTFFIWTERENKLFVTFKHFPPKLKIYTWKTQNS